MISLRLLQNSETVDFEPGETIFSAGEEGHTMYVVRYGEVDIVIDTKDGPWVAETVTPGGIFGEMALIDRQKRSATAVARTRCSLAMLTQSQFQLLITETPFFALYVMSTMAERLRKANARLGG